MTLAFDENLPPAVAQALALVGHPVTHVVEHLPRGTVDDLLFAEAARREWVLVTRDANMWRKRAQRAALLQAGIGVFVIVSSTAHSAADLLALLSRRMSETVDLMARTRKPFVLRVPDRGKIQPFG